MLVLFGSFILSEIVLYYRETGALCAMKEVELLHDDPKSAECIKQLEQVISGIYNSQQLIEEICVT